MEDDERAYLAQCIVAGEEPEFASEDVACWLVAASDRAFELDFHFSGAIQKSNRLCNLRTAN